MKKHWHFIFLAAAAVLFTLPVKAQVIVIANPSVKADSVSKGELKDVFTGESSSLKEGGHVVPVFQKEGATHSEFLSSYLGESPAAILICWRGIVMSGRGSMPKSLDSDTAVVEYVAKTAGAIGYISKSAPHDGVKELAVH
jgi:ABC-type phosphate transport system substrate-binding protein